MSNYISEYNSKKISLEEGLSLFKDNYVFATSSNAIEPSALFGSLHTLQGKVSGLSMHDSITMREYPFMCDPQYKGLVDVQTQFLMGPARKGQKMGIVHHMPGDLHFGARTWLKAHDNHINIFWGMASPMDKHGYMSMSLCMIHEKQMLEAADIVVLEINPNVPFACGDTEVHIRDVDYIIENDCPLPELPRSNPTAIDDTIGGYVASLINDGDTIQLGIGNMPDAVAKELMTKKDLGVHTELISNSMLDLVEAGVITGRRKTLHKGKMVTGFVMGERKLYDFIDHNPGVLVLQGNYTNAPQVIAQNDNMVSVNSTLSVDLTGQCCSESLGFTQYSGAGGQADTAIGASHAKGGRSIIALHSTAKNGTISTITACLAPGSIVSLSRTVPDCIITEYGIAWLRGRSVKQRAENLIAVAHPDFRAELRAEAEKYWLL